MGKKKNRNDVFERRRREARRRGSSAQCARSFNAASIRGWGSAVSSPSGSGRSPTAKRHLVHFWSENALSGQGPRYN